ncbi:MAG: DinB family protein [Chitinophagales bacterium]|nr:DinB family protein [Chitinophagales bacterium]HMV13961.1 DinB family protein [Chitinophagales bacterium]HMW12264.1 DinB family protein [Chitinophagales bacterium]HMX58941.1 DinB family protein [Chitinophagales bacterium]HMY22679.1 DinB family protein [Chitinophagales bacterium]
MKTKQEIKIELNAVFAQLTELVNTTDANRFKKSKNGKWNIAQNIDHLTLSNNITMMALHTPKMALKQLYNTNNRTNWNYEEVVWKYQLQLNTGAKASLPFVPKLGYIPVKSILVRLWKLSCVALLKSLDAWSENDLDTYIIPHPIIGKITARELLYFTIYHCKHHLQTMQHLASA